MTKLRFYFDNTQYLRTFDTHNHKDFTMKEALVDVSVLILFFNRPDTLAQVFNEVRKARPARLFLYQDGPRSEADMPRLLACRRVAEEAIDWECEVHRLYQTENYGCDPSEFISQKWAFSITDKCIVLEDDDVPTVSFFHFCKDMLDRYADDTRVTMIAGFNVDEETPDVEEDYFFTTHLSIWGWASWRRVVDRWDEHYTWLDNRQTVAQLEGIIRERGYRDDFLDMCRKHRANGKAYYETIFWSHLMLSNGLCIMPRRNQINNLGVSTESTHFGGALETLPRAYRRIFTMRRLEMDAYTRGTPLRHPTQMVEHLPYRHRAYRTLGWMCPWVKVGRSLEELWLNLRYGNFSYIMKAVANRLRIWTKGREYK